MLPQFQALEAAVADKLQGMHETDRRHAPPYNIDEGREPQGSVTKARKGTVFGVISMAVFVIDRRKKPLMPCSEKRARLLLERERARIHRIRPFTIRLVDRTQENSVLQPLRLKLDPGSKITGVALVHGSEANCRVVALSELEHRGRQISEALTARRAFRQRRRSTNLRYRAPRFDNRRRPDGWLPPSLQHRVDSAVMLVNRFRRLAPVGTITMELVRFDTQALENPEITGIEYQQGTLAGYEVREYLLEKWGRQCVYCDRKNVPLQIDHIEPRSKKGSDRISNLTLACEKCNQAKSDMDVREFLREPERIKRILATAKTPLRDAAAVNATRWSLYRALKTTGLPVACSTGGRTKYNRCRLNIPKSHALDAACTGVVESLSGWQRPTFVFRATGRGSYQRTRLTKYGFPRGYLMRQKQAHSFQTGDMVYAEVPAGAKAGTYTGRVAVRSTGSFNIQTADAVVQGISYRYCRLLQRNDGYSYYLKPIPGKENAGGTGTLLRTLRYPSPA